MESKYFFQKSKIPLDLCTNTKFQMIRIIGSVWNRCEQNMKYIWSLGRFSEFQGSIFGWKWPFLAKNHWFSAFSRIYQCRLLHHCGPGINVAFWTKVGHVKKTNYYNEKRLAAFCLVFAKKIASDRPKMYKPSKNRANFCSSG